MFGVGSVPSSGIPDVTELQHVQSTLVVGTGENMTLFVSLKEHDSESLLLSLGCDGAQTVGAVIPKWYSSTSFNISRVGHREAFSADPDEPFVVFRYTERRPNPGGGLAVDISSEEGVVVWAVPTE